MSNRALYSCICALLKLAIIHSVHIRRRCNSTWRRSLKDLSTDRLVSRLKYILWWTPLRVIVVAFDRGILRGQRVLTCVFEELQRRGLENSQSVRGIRDEIRCEYYLS